MVFAVFRSGSTWREKGTQLVSFCQFLIEKNRNSRKLSTFASSKKGQRWVSNILKYVTWVCYVCYTCMLLTQFVTPMHFFGGGGNITELYKTGMRSAVRPCEPRETHSSCRPLFVWLKCADAVQSTPKVLLFFQVLTRYTNHAILSNGPVRQRRDDNLSGSLSH